MPTCFPVIWHLNPGAKQFQPPPSICWFFISESHRKSLSDHASDQFEQNSQQAEYLCNKLNHFVFAHSYLRPSSHRRNGRSSSVWGLELGKTKRRCRPDNTLVTIVCKRRLRPQRYAKAGRPNSPIRPDACAPPHHGFVTVNRVNIRVLPPMGTLKTCCGGTPVSMIGVQLNCRSAALHPATYVIPDTPDGWLKKTT